MRALIYDGQAVRFRKYHPDPPAAAGSGGAEEALVQVRLAGLCQTDLEIAKGYMGFTGVLGHEFVGTVLKIHGKNTTLLGKRVCGEINCVCGKCDMCQRGLATHCRNRTVLGIAGRDGAFADLLVLPVRNLHVVPDNVADEQAVFAEPLAAAVQVLRQVPVDARTHALVLGDGRLGQLVAQVLHAAGCPVLLVGRHEGKLAVAERLGIRTALDKDAVPRREQDLVVECTGRAEGLERAIAFLRPRGTLVLKTTVAAGKAINLAPLVIDEITVVGSRCGPIAEALKLLATGKVNVAGLISRRVKIEAGESLFAVPLPVDTLKVLLTFDR